MQTQPDASPDHRRRTRAPRVVPTVALLVAALVAAAWLVPGARDQLRLSTSRQPEHVVELYFDRPVAAGAQHACVRRHGSVRVPFAVTSHLEERRTLRYRVVVDPVRRGERPRVRTGRIHARPGHPVHLVARFGRVGGGYLTRVSLPALRQQLRLHCPGSTR